ncbi:viroplasmin family protein [Clostridium oryzae]|uniref:ribonuclease H n=1 Tax=Clostridium oryzae TaxID=1450648 RepID=A0A1V4IGC3_9CLOT|nr:ribonuclease H family protein [Clostridium oryzae]OPJ59003.1 ribonuclease H [Clostridium oryzae]
MSKKVYAVKEGYDFANDRKVENLILSSWSECEKYVKGVKGAKYKSFLTADEAEKYLNQETGISKEKLMLLPDVFYAYVDGSYNDATGKYSYALVIIRNNVIRYIENGSAEDDSERSIRQIAGELKAAIRSLEYCADNRINEIVIFHDYEGVRQHALGTWSRREKSSQKYYQDYNHIINKYDIKVHFMKVESHTGDLYNEMADELAKYAAHIPIKGVTNKNIVNNTIFVNDTTVKDKLMDIISPENSDNIIILEK